MSTNISNIYNLNIGFTGLKLKESDSKLVLRETTSLKNGVLYHYEDAHGIAGGLYPDYRYYITEGEEYVLKNFRTEGFISNSSKSLYIPFFTPRNVTGSAPTLKELVATIRVPSGGYAYLPLASGYQIIQDVDLLNSANSAKLTHSILMCGNGMRINLTYDSAISKNSSGTTLTNNTPVGVLITRATFQF